MTCGSAAGLLAGAKPAALRLAGFGTGDAGGGAPNRSLISRAPWRVPTPLPTPRPASNSAAARLFRQTCLSTYRTSTQVFPRSIRTLKIKE